MFTVISFQTKDFTFLCVPDFVSPISTKNNPVFTVRKFPITLI